MIDMHREEWQLIKSKKGQCFEDFVFEVNRNIFSLVEKWNCEAEVTQFQYYGDCTEVYVKIKRKEIG